MEKTQFACVFAHPATRYATFQSCHTFLPTVSSLGFVHNYTFFARYDTYFYSASFVSDKVLIIHSDHYWIRLTLVVILKDSYMIHLRNHCKGHWFFPDLLNSCTQLILFWSWKISKMSGNDRVDDLVMDQNLIISDCI